MNLYEALNYCYKHHDVTCNQKYSDNLPYSFHLKMAVGVVNRFNYILPPEHHYKVIVSGGGHDLIEDGRLTYNNIKDLFGHDVAEIIYACTDEKGKNRDERHSDKFYTELAKNRLAVFVKLCDMVANATYSRVMGSRHFNGYKSDLPKIKEKLYIKGEYDKLWDELELILT